MNEITQNVTEQTTDTVQELQELPRTCVDPKFNSEEQTEVIETQEAQS